MALHLGLACLLCSLGLPAARDEAVVFVVDPTWDCVESYVAHVPLLQEYKVIKVWTRLGTAPKCNSDHADIYKTITYNSWTPDDTLATAEICPQLQSLGFPVKAVIPTFDPAAYLADRLAACVGARGNPSVGPLATARRDKWVMSEAVRKAGLRSVQEKLVSNWAEAKDHLESLSTPLSHANPVFFKVLQGSSSAGDQIVYSFKQAEDIFSGELGSTSKLGDKITKILIQEYLRGKEYVIDSASRDGVHKTVMVFHEDLRPGNGHFDLYFGFKTMDPKDEKTKKIIDYANGVLDATGFRNGASDMEVMWLEDEGQPCVVDLNPRWGSLMWDDGLWLENAISGNNQITATINAWLDADAFNAMPSVPSLQQHGALMFTQVFHEGILKGVPGLAVAKQMPSYFGEHNVMAYAGNLMIPSDKSPLKIMLADKDKAVMDADYDRIVDMENSGTFYDVAPSNAALTALSPGAQLFTVAAFALLAVAAGLALAASSWRHARDSTVYLAIE